ncbi:MAG TPA: hypothetical protein VGF82_02295 [Terracidiphilus sp.]|jgi:hypothetical protein
MAIFSSKKKQEVDLDADNDFRQRIEERIRQALFLPESPTIESLLESEHKSVNVAEIQNENQSMTAIVPKVSEPEEVTEYSYLRPANGPESLRGRYRPAFRTM